MSNNYFLSKNPTPSYTNINKVGSVLKTGGTTSYIQKISSFFSNNFKILAIIIIVFLLLIFAYLTYKQYVEQKTVFHANRENMSKDQNSNKTATLMLFFVDWCPHCKTAKPEWESLKTSYDGKSINGYTVNFIEYNCTNESEEITQLMDKYSIEGFPTVKLIKDNQVIEYDAKPTKSTMEQFLNTVL
jgi:thiol-disulfide isomerase/thioredoxin